MAGIYEYMSRYLPMWIASLTYEQKTLALKWLLWTIDHDYPFVDRAYGSAGTMLESKVLDHIDRRTAHCILPTAIRIANRLILRLLIGEDDPARTVDNRAEPPRIKP